MVTGRLTPPKPRMTKKSWIWFALKAFPATLLPEASIAVGSD
jgi:hypothetical protein